jgi:hypothetical protein
MKKLIYLLAFLFFMCMGELSHAQRLMPAERKVLVKKEDSLKVFADSMINAQGTASRFRADSNFVRMLVRGLLVKNSFSYPFDSLRTISRLYPPDSSFRIFTWQLKKDDYLYLQKGAIQVRTADGSLKLFPLYDMSMFTAKPLDSVRTNKNWIGAIYYKIIQKSYNGQKYYTLLGFDDYNIGSNRKWMEVLTFNDKGEPQFGGPFISFKEDTAKKKDISRFNIEYKKEAATTFNYNPELDMIIFDHLISETDEPERKETYIPDGDFEGFKWKDGQWVHVDKVFDFKLSDGDFPVEEGIYDASGKPNEEKLMDRSKQNMEKGKKPASKTPVKKKSTAASN